MRRLGGALVLAVAVAVVALAVVAASSPVRLAETFPTDGDALKAPPAEVWIAFSDVVRPQTFHLAVVPDGGGPPVSGTAHLDGSFLAVPVSISGPGGYRVGYHVLLPDGRQLSGVTRFSVTGAGDPVAALRDPATAARDLSDPGICHEHAGRDPLTLGLLVVDLVLIVGLLAVMIRRSRPRPPPPS
ncbi:MAG TPA: copper resistance CopC family protein [Asanoa sp.]|nr:copper resistance CopC family protein [Asanoa sp.]